jgi:hypothetical protein
MPKKWEQILHCALNCGIYDILLAQIIPKICESGRRNLFGRDMNRMRSI